MESRIHDFSEWSEEHNDYSSSFVFPQVSPVLDTLSTSWMAPQWKQSSVCYWRLRWTWVEALSWLNPSLAWSKLLVLHGRWQPVCRTFFLQANSLQGKSEKQLCPHSCLPINGSSPHILPFFPFLLRFPCLPSPTTVPISLLSAEGINCVGYQHF